MKTISNVFMKKKKSNFTLYLHHANHNTLSSSGQVTYSRVEETLQYLS